MSIDKRNTRKLPYQFYAHGRTDHLENVIPRVYSVRETPKTLKEGPIVYQENEYQYRCDNPLTDNTKGPKYIPLARRGDKPDAIAWIVKNHPEVKNNQISKLIGTTKDTIEKIRTRSHWNISNITAKHPVLLSLCSQEDLDEAIIKAGGSVDAENDGSIPTSN